MILAQQLMYSTVRLELPTEIGLRTGTGFFFNLFGTEKITVPVIVTNKHVVEGANTLRFRVPLSGSDGKPVLGQFRGCQIDDLDKVTIPHPNVDLAIIPLAAIMAVLIEQQFISHAAFLSSTIMPDTETISRFSPLEPLLTVGYPGQLWDHVNNLPLFHRGGTATPINIDFQGRKEFLVDFATWPGSSGSPVFVYNEMGYFDAKSNAYLMGANRIFLAGVVYGVATQEVGGNVVIKTAPTQPTELASYAAVPTNLGACIKASCILDFEKLIIARGFTPPDNYVSRT